MFLHPIRASRVVLIFAACLALAVAGCPRNGEPGTGIPAEELCDELLTAYCAYAARCEAASPFGLALTQIIACHPEIRAVTCEREFGSFVDAVNSGNIDYDGTAARACIDGLTAAACGTADEFLADLCGDAVVGTLSMGDPCNTEGECAPGLYCAGTTCPGTCAMRLPVASMCTATGDCQDGLTCDSNDLCAAPGGLGALCTGLDDCGDGFACFMGMCAAEGGSGAACEVSLFGGQGTCSPGLVCGGGLCGAGGVLGDACDGMTPCGLDFRCVEVDPITGDRECIGTAAPGAACTSTEQCPLGLGCDGGSCVPLPTSGESCVPDSFDCVEGVCQGGVCTLLPDGSMCEPGGLLASFDACTNVCRSDTMTCGPAVSSGGMCSVTAECGAGLECENGSCQPVCAL